LVNIEGANEGQQLSVGLPRKRCPSSSLSIHWKTFAFTFIDSTLNLPRH